jgi:exosome complex RNA-binding protein Rrp42 (RNase PH superfamily)
MVHMVDPTIEEEESLSGSLTIIVNARQPEEVLSVDFSSLTPMTRTDLALAIKMAIGRGTEVGAILSP